MLKSKRTEIRGSYEVHSELNPRSSAVELAGVSGPRKLTPIPFEGFQHLETLPRSRRVGDDVVPEKVGAWIYTVG
jgi:hypothetical protein